MKLHRGRQNVTLWLKPEHVEALDNLAEGWKMDLGPFIISRIADAIAYTHLDPKGELSNALLKDLAQRQHRVPQTFDI